MPIQPKPEFHSITIRETAKKFNLEFSLAVRSAPLRMWFAQSSNWIFAAVGYPMPTMTRLFARGNLLALLVFFLGLLPLDGAQFYCDWAATRFTDIPAQSGATNDPDGDGSANLVEFAFGTEPRVPDGITGAVNPKSGSTNGTNGIFSVEVLERVGRQPGAQIDLQLSSRLDGTNWFRPWWLRGTTNSLPSDPAGSVRESFTTRLPGTNQWFVRSSVQLIEGGAEAANYYVATNGSDGNNGTSTNTPFATLNFAATKASAGNLIYVRGGTYNWTAQAALSLSGSPTQPIRIRAYPGEQPVCDFLGEPSGKHGILISGNWWQIYGLEIVHANHNGILIQGSSNVVERCVIHESGDTGLNISAGATTLASSNLILNCDSYRNYDIGANGGNADGFTAKFTIGPGNVFRGCRSWNNSDDGWDFWRATNMIVVDHCITFSNGFDVFGVSNFAGDGNGFKMGGDYQPGPHRYLNCVSFGNRVNGYDQNNNTAGLTVDNCTAWANGGANFNLNHDSTNAPMVSVHVVRNNLSIAGHSADSFFNGSLLTNNSWLIITNPLASATDLLSTNAAYALAPRRDDGSLSESPFLRPVPTGRLVNKGANIGETFSGSAPDLGAYETPEW
jgi:hypothetical protein